MNQKAALYWALEAGWIQMNKIVFIVHRRSTFHALNTRYYQVDNDIHAGMASRGEKRNGYVTRVRLHFTERLFGGVLHTSSQMSEYLAIG